MAWNRPSENGEAVSRPLQKRSGDRFPARGAIAGAVVVLGAAVAAWWLWPNGESAGETPPPQTKQRIKEVKSAPAPKAAKVPRELSEEEKQQEEIKKLERLYGDNMPQGLKTYIYYLKHPPKRIFGADDKYAYLKHPCEKHLASFLTIVPGMYFIQCPDFDESFDTDFVNAMRDDIVIDPRDPADVKEMKQAIIDIKNEIAEACRKEDKLPSQIMNEHAMSLFELGKYQENMRQQLNEIYNSPKYTDADVKDFCTAANMMLKDNGLQPLPYPDLTERTLELQYNLKHAEGGMGDEGENNE